jgi:TRAP-type C4-dicarboxylate transport system substrate-binding protein
MVGVFKLWRQKKKRLMITLVFSLLGICYAITFLSHIDSTCVALEPSMANRDTKIETTVLLRLAHSVKQDHPTHIMAQEVAKEIYTKTNGKIRLEI